MTLDRRIFAQTMVEDQQKLVAYVLARGGGHQVAEDVVQDVFALALENMETFNDADHLQAWCRETARRKQLEHLRRLNRQPQALDSQILELLDPHFAELQATDGVALEALEHCLQAISPEARAIVEQRYQHGLTGKKLAEKVGRNFNTVYSTLARAHQALGDCVRRRLGEDL